MATLQSLEQNLHLFGACCRGYVKQAVTTAVPGPGKREFITFFTAPDHNNSYIDTTQTENR